MRLPPPTRFAVNITAEVETKGQKGIDEFITKYELEVTSSPIFIKANTRGDLQPGVVKEYHNRWVELGKFFFMIGDYQSAALCDRARCPVNPLPMKPESLTLYMDFKFGSKDTPLLKYGTTDQNQLDVLGNIILCQGEWHCPANADKIRAAVHCIHEAYDDLRGTYYEACSTCVNLNTPHTDDDSTEDGAFKACRRHASSPLLLPRGNAILSKKFKDVMLSWKAKKLQDYTRKGNIFLLPGELRQLRNFLIGANDLESLQTYVMLLLGVKLFLRAEEMLTIKLGNDDDSNFNQATQNYQVIHPDCIKSLAIRVKGKTDTVWHTLRLKCDDECPHFCPVRHLLVYLKKLGLKGGYLFPPSHQLAGTSRPTNGIFTEHVCYKTWLAKMKGLMTRVLSKNVGPECCVGTHTLRKTAYLFAIWGCLRAMPNIRQPDQFPDLMLAFILTAARHKSIQNAKTYARDSAALLGLVKDERNPEYHMVSQWEAIHISTLSCAATITTPSRPHQKPLPELADWYFSNVIKIVDEDSLTIARACDFAIAVQPQLESKEALIALLSQALSPEVATAAIGLLNRTLEDTTRAASSTIIQTIPVDAGMDPQLHPLVSPVQQRPAKRKRGSGNQSCLVGYAEIRNLKTEAKVAKIVEFYKLADLRPSRFPEKERTWWNKNCSFVGWCVEACYGSDQERFVNSLGSQPFFPSKYRCTACKSSKPTTLGG